MIDERKSIEELIDELSYLVRSAETIKDGIREMRLSNEADLEIIKGFDALYEKSVRQLQDLRGIGDEILDLANIKRVKSELESANQLMKNTFVQVEKSIKEIKRLKNEGPGYSKIKAFGLGAASTLVFLLVINMLIGLIPAIKTERYYSDGVERSKSGQLTFADQVWQVQTEKEGTFTVTLRRQFSR